MANLTDRTAIQVGDMVVCVSKRTCCGDERGIGRVFTVAGFFDVIRCSDCGVRTEILSAATGHGIECCEVSRLKRIPPLEELEGTKTDEPIQEPS